jgi:exodeoxyribonuclease VII large subunit
MLPSPLLDTPKIYTISELNETVHDLLEDALPSLWVSGEISNLYIQSSSGHIYFSLKDERAQVRCAMFRAHNNQLTFQIKNGMQVVVQAHVSLYEARGDYQLIVQSMEQAGAGLLQQKFLALKAKLEKEGLFDQQHKKALPPFPRCIGVVTSPSGAAIHDILSVLQRRNPFVSIIIYPTQVQGAEAPEQIVRAITTANERHECDLLIIGRGGGSLEDLWAFNDEAVARAIFASSIPTISAVGHEIDFTIADFVADHRAPTPSAAAEIAVPSITEKIRALSDNYNKLIYLIEHKISAVTTLLNAWAARLQHPQKALQQKAQRIDELEQKLQLAWRHNMHSWQHKLTNFASTLNALSPLATLQRGYAIVRHKTKKKSGKEGKGVAEMVEEKIIKDVRSLQSGDEVNVQLANGSFDGRVITTSST